MINKLDYERIKFPISKKNYCKIDRQNNVCTNVFCYESGLIYPIHVSNQKFKDCMDLLLTSTENKSHYVYIKDLNRFMYNKRKKKNEKYFCKCCLQYFSSAKVLIKHRENCLMINGKQNVKLKRSSISLKSCFKQVLSPLKIYADFECILKKVECDSIKNNSSYTEKYELHITCSFAYKVICIDKKFSKKVVLYRGTNAVYKFIEAILSEYSYCTGAGEGEGGVIKKNSLIRILLCLQKKKKKDFN